VESREHNAGEVKIARAVRQVRLRALLRPAVVIYGVGGGGGNTR